MPMTLVPGSSRASFAGRTAPVVDDNAENKEVMVGMLRSLGIEPIEAASAAEALELDPATLDLLVVDVMLPGGQTTERCRCHAAPETQSAGA